METLITIFIAVTAAGVLLQAGLLAGMYLSMRKTSARMEALAGEVKTKALPAIETAQSVLTEVKPKIEEIVENVKQMSASVRAEMGRIDATVNDVVDRARLQVIRADEMLTRTFDRVEYTSDVVQKTVMSPVRQFSGVLQGVTAGLEYLFGNRGRKNGGNRERRAVPQDEMFI
jgi:ABC-type transporter Mla subunit MlaD